MSQMPDDAKYCGVCHLPKKEHKKLEKAGDIHHEFTMDSQLIPIKGSPSPGGQSNTSTTVQVPFDPVLRVILLEKGLITSEELQAKTDQLRDGGILIANLPGEPRDT